MPQESNDALRAHNVNKHPGTSPYLFFRLRYAIGQAADLNLVVSSQGSPSQLCMRQDRGMRVEKMAKKLYRCSSCAVGFAQRQGLTRHSKDKHSPKNRCDFCVDFTSPQG